MIVPTIPPVRLYMTRSPHSIRSDQNLVEAHQMMREHAIRHLPVLRSDALVGVVSARDLSQIETLMGTNPKEVTVGDAMSPWTYAVSPETPLDRVVDEMASRKLGCAVVIEHNKVVGILTTTDVCEALCEVLQGRVRGQTREAGSFLLGG